MYAKRYFQLRSIVIALFSFTIPLLSHAYNKSWDQGHLVCVVEPGTSNWGKFDASGVFHGGYTSKECCQKYCKVCPVYANTGQLQESFTDLMLPGVGPALSIKRTYNSQDGATSFLGNGWTFNFGKRLIIARRNDNEKIVGLVLETGEKNYYKENADGTLERLTGYGAAFDLTKNPNGTYTIRELNGSRTEIKADGKIDRIIDRNGNGLSFQYTPVGCVSRITNASGNFVDFVLGPNGKIVSATDNLGRTIAYGYDENGNLMTVTDPLGNSVRYVYNSANLLTQRIDARGSIVETIGYDTNQPPRVANFVEKGEAFTVSYFTNHTEKTDSQGNKWTYYYNDVGVIERIVDPLGNETKQNLNKITATSVDWEEDTNGNRTTYTYDILGNMTSRTDALGNTWSYTYVAGTDWVQTETNPAGTVTKHQYDAKGNRIKTTYDFGGALANSTTSTFDAAGNKTSVTDPLGHTTTYAYDADGNLNRMSDPLGNVTTYAYDSRGNRLTETDAKGNKTTYTYDLLNRLLTVTDALNNKTTYTYNANGNKITETNASSETTTYAYDTYNRIINMTGPLGNTTSSIYDWRDNLISRTDASGNTTKFAYDILNRLIKETDPLGGQTVYTYDPTGNLLSVMDANGKVTRFSYDANNQRLSDTNPANETTNYVYDEKGNLITTTYPNGNTVTNIYDALNRLVSSSDSLGLLKSFSYDAVGRLLAETDALGNTVSYSLDAIGRVIQKTDALGNSNLSSYDSVGNLITTTDREGNIKRQSYDALGRKISETDALGNTTIFAYDGVGNLLSITDANGNQTSYSYDARNKLIQETYADGTIRTFGYDSVGNRIARTDQNGQTTTYVYDKLNRPIKVDYPGTNDKVITYDAVSNLLSVNNQDSTVSLSYDDAYRITQSVQNGQAVAYSYDIAKGERTVTYPAGKVIKEIRNLRNFLIRIENAISQPVVQYTYDGANRLLSKNYLNGILANYNHNPNGWVTELGYQNEATQIIGYQYGFDREGNRQYAKSLHDGNSSEQYSYDGKYRLNEFKRGVLDSSNQIPTPMIQTSYSLDALANWQRKTTDGIIQNRTHNEINELVNVNGVAYSYDSNGNLIDDGAKIYQYDYENRLVAVIRKSDGLTLGTYKYDALGRRVEEQMPTTAIHYFYDGMKVIEEQIDDATVATYVFGNGIDQVESMERDGITYFYHSNSLGSTIALTDANGNIVEEYSYDAYGNVNAVSTVGNPYLFAGRSFSQEIEAYYYRARTYNPFMGRFLQRDPFAFVGGMNLYEYVASNPINYIDPYGLAWYNPWDWIVGAERWIWMQVANYYMRPRGLTVSAELLEHSLLDNPLPLNPYNNANAKIRGSTEYSNFINSIQDGNYSSWVGPGTIEFRSDLDLFAAFQHVRMFYKGCKFGSWHDLHIKITDTYTFHWQRLESSSFFNFLTTLGANFAYIDQLLGIITPYDIEIAFKDP